MELMDEKMFPPRGSSGDVSNQLRGVTRKSHDAGLHSMAPRETKSSHNQLFASLLNEPVPSNYTGPVFVDNPDIQFALALLEFYQQDPLNRLPRCLVAKILKRIEDQLAQNIHGSVVYYEVPKRPQVQLCIVGDVHGQLNDVLWVFYQFGTPSTTRAFLFNGDIADRGSFAVEIFLILFAFKLALPNNVLINRGNHENANMNEIYGFAQEVRRKYSSTIYQKFQDIFNLLPLCVVIDKKILVVHGGLLRHDGITLETINQIDRKRQCPSSPLTLEDEIMFDMLWSDPMERPGRNRSGRGADCISFGPDITRMFLDVNHLDVCIRSHQVPSSLRGFSLHHNGRCITLFSASNYCGTSGNFGGVIIFNPSLTFEINEYFAPQLNDLREVHNATKNATSKVARLTGLQGGLSTKVIKDVEQKAEQWTRRTSVHRMEEDMMKRTARIICERKTDIWEKVWDADVAKTGIISIENFKECIDDVLGHSIPVDLFWDRLNLKTPENTINYNEFLKEFRVEFRPKHASHENWRFEAIQQVFEAIMKTDLTLKETLLIFDRNSDGTVSYRDFSELLSEIHPGLSEAQVRLLLRIITADYVTRDDTVDSVDNTLRVDVAEFLGRFKVIYGQTVKPRKNEPPWIPRALEIIGRYILADKVETAERHYNNTSGKFGSWNIHTCTVASSDDPSVLLSRRRSSAIRSVALFQKFKDLTYTYGDGPDPNQDETNGYLSYKDFLAAIRRLPVASIEAELNLQLDDNKLNELARYIDMAGSGRINYFEFLNAFYVVDSGTRTQVAEEIWRQICGMFYQQKVTLRQALLKLDSKGTGIVDADEFGRVLATMNSLLGTRGAPLTSEQLDLIVTCIESDDNNLIDYNSFLDSFTVVDFWSDKMKST